MYLTVKKFYRPKNSVKRASAIYTLLFWARIGSRPNNYRKNGNSLMALDKKNIDLVLPPFDGHGKKFCVLTPHFYKEDPPA